MTLKKSLLLPILFLLMIFSCNDQTVKQKKIFFKGFMIDAARTVEKMDHYYRLVDFFAENDFNCILFRLTDDEGCAMKFKSHPELKTHEGAYTADEIKKLVTYAEEKGIEIIPEIESFGHTRYITDVKQYHYLQDILDTTITWANGICPVSDTTRQIMKDLYTEAAEIFSSRYLHIGCDETNWGGNERTKKALEEKSKIELWSEYVNTLNGYVKGLGKTAVIWGDVPIREENEILEMLEKDIIIMDWNYWYTKADSARKNANKMLKNGFRIIGSPAVNWMMWGPRIGEIQLKNLEAYSKAYHTIKNKNNFGIIVTHWCPYRYTQNTQWDSYYLCSQIVNNELVSLESGLQDFTINHFGCTWNDEWKKIYENLYGLTPKNKYHGEENGVKRFYPWRNEDDVKELFAKEKTLEIESDFRETLRMLLNQSDSVTQNKEDFDELVFSVKFMIHMFWREQMLFGHKTNMKGIEETLMDIAEKDAMIMEEMQQIWSKNRKGSINEKFLWEFPKATAYSKHLSKNPEKIKNLISE